MRMLRTSRLLALLVLAAACQGSRPATLAPAPAREVVREQTAGDDAVPLPAPDDTTDAPCFGPNVEDGDGTPGFIHVVEADMPLRVAIGYPKVPPRYGSRADGRAVSIEAMQLWETAIKKRLAWFELEFVKEDPDAAIQVTWSRVIAGPWGGFGWITWRVDDGRLRVGGAMKVSTTPQGHSGLEARIKLDELRLLIAHEFGHVLGLPHCFDESSAMSYAWHTRGRILVTELDVRNFLALVAQPNGTRIDGRPLGLLP